MSTLGRNDPCHCGSGKKYKKCHLAKDEEKERKALAKATFQPKIEAPAEGGSKPPPPKEEKKGWFSGLFKKGGGDFRPPSRAQSSNRGGGGS